MPNKRLRWLNLQSMSKLIISTPRLNLREWKQEDTGPFIKMNMDKEVMRYFPSIQNEAETTAQIARIKQHFNDYGYGLYALERKDTGAFIGFTGFAHPRFESFFTPCVEIGWRLNKEHWNMGFATEAARACIKFGFGELNFNEIVSFTAVVNLPSINVMKKSGLSMVGEFEHPLVKEGHVLRSHVLYKIALKK
jgi:[ribosomal protein S5]-alanine N-acetyltransferase